jgi:hypothetical protein
VGVDVDPWARYWRERGWHTAAARVGLEGAGVGKNGVHVAVDLVDEALAGGGLDDADVAAVGHERLHHEAVGVLVDAPVGNKDPFLP